MPKRPYHAIFIAFVVLVSLFVNLVHAELTEAQCRACMNAQQICGSTHCDHCITDQQCQDLFGSPSVCRSGNDSSSACNAATGCICVHKSLGDGLSFADIGPALFMILGGAAAAGGGVGGGGVFVPVLIMFAGFSTKEAIPLSTVMIGCASIANFFQLRTKKHPLAPRPIIDYNIALLMQPTSMGGTILGVILNQVLPEWVLLILLISLIAVTIYRSGKKGLTMYKTETAKMASAPASPMPVASPLSSPDGNIELDTIGKEPLSPVESPRPTSNVEWMPWNVLGALVAILLLVTAHAIIVGGKSSKVSALGVHRCSSLYWLLFVTVFPILGYIAYWAVQRAARVHDQAVASGVSAVEGDVSWTLQRAGMVSGGSLVAGILSSALGIGGGMVLGPIMLELGMLPDVTAATSSFMILFTAWSGVFQYAIAKRIRYDYALFFGVAGIVSSVLGQSALDYMVKKHGRKSLIVFAAVFIIAISAVLLTFTSGRSIYWNIQAGADMGFRSYC